MTTMNHLSVHAKFARRIGAILLGVLLGGCQSDTAIPDEPIAAYRDRMLVQHQEQARAAAEAPQPYAVPRDPVAQPVAAQAELPERPALIVKPDTTSQPAPLDILQEIPDPSHAAEAFALRLQRVRQEQAGQRDQRVVRKFEQVIQHTTDSLKQLERPQQVRLSLADCVRRAIENNYTIRIEAHSPAISQTQVVEAEAAFDTEFYLDTLYSKQDQATVSVFAAGSVDTRSVSGGFRKLLPSGMQTSVGLSLQRQQTNFPAEFQSLNPAYTSSFVAEFRQPLLRGFGLDVNRAQIEIRRAEQRTSYENFIQQVRDTLLRVESAYWALARARRAVVISAEALAQNYATWQNMIQRLAHDATQVEVANSESRYRTAQVAFLESVKLVRDAEDQLKNLLNDPELKLSDDIEIVTGEVPVVAPTVLDQFAEVRTALEQRSEIRQAREQIEAARISTNAAKNAILPQLDLSFQYQVDGIGPSADSAFDNVTQARFQSYTVSVNFAYNFGERAARAAHRRARLQESQAVVALNQASDTIVQEVNDGIRTLLVRYEQIPPAVISVRAAERNLRSLQARTQRIDPSYLQTELAAVEQLTNTRRTLLQVITEYNVGLIELERAKGTLLDYNNVVVTDAPAGR